MPRPTTEADYRARIDRVIRAIAADLDAPLDLNALADIACFSPYHFHRAYRAIAGETAAETVRRLRLHRAANALLSADTPIAEIAARAGYSGPDAFSRAFAAAYGATPAVFRARGALAAPHRPTATEDPLTTYQIDIADRPALRLAAFGHRGPYQDIGPVFERVMIWAHGEGLAPPLRAVGVYYDDPEAVAPSELRSDAGVVISAEVGAEVGIASGGADGALDPHLVDLAGGPYALLKHVGPYATLPAAWAFLYREWLPKSGREPAAAPSFEEYLNDPRSVAPEALETLICAPLRA